MNWRVILTIAQKDIVDAVKNLYLAFALVLPIGLALVLRLVIPEEQPGLVIAVFDQGNSQLVENLSALGRFEVREVGSEQEAIEAAGDEAVGSLVIPAGFDAALQAGEQPELVVYQNHKVEFSRLAVLQRTVETQVLALAGIEYPARIQWNGVPFVNQERASSSSSSAGSGFSISMYMLGLFLVMGLAMAGVFMVPYLMVEEKEKHTLDALLLSPARPVEVIAGKAIVGLFYSLILALILLTLSEGWAGDWPVSLLAVFLGALFVVGVGLLLGSALSTMHQVNTWSSILMLALMVPSWIGIFNLPKAVETLFKLFPTYYLPATLDLSLAGNAASTAVWTNLAILAGSAVLVYVLVVWVLGRQARA